MSTILFRLQCVNNTSTSRAKRDIPDSEATPWRHARMLGDNNILKTIPLKESVHVLHLFYVKPHYSCNTWLVNLYNFTDQFHAYQLTAHELNKHECIALDMVSWHRWLVIQQGISRNSAITMTSSDWKIFRITGLYEGNQPVTGGFLSQRPETRSFDVSLICAWTNGWANNRDGDDLKHHRAHYDVTVIMM